MNLIKNCFLHGRYEGDECGGCAAMRKERGTDKDAELATLRAEVPQLKKARDDFAAECDTWKKATQGWCEKERKARAENERLRDLVETWKLDLAKRAEDCRQGDCYAPKTAEEFEAMIDGTLPTENERLRAEVERLRAVAEESLKVMRGSCEMSCAEDPAWYRGKVPSLAWDALCSALFDWDEKKALAALDAKEGTDAT